MTVIEAAVEVLRNAQRPLTASEIFLAIKGSQLYSFAAKDPLNVVRGQLRRHSEGYNRPTAATKRVVRQLSDEKFELL